MRGQPYDRRIHTEVCRELDGSQSSVHTDTGFGDRLEFAIWRHGSYTQESRCLLPQPTVASLHERRSDRDMKPLHVLIDGESELPGTNPCG
jgi:hypothetical protein